MSSPVINLAVSLGAMQGLLYWVHIYYPCSWTSSVARRIPFEDPEILNYVRIAYVVSQVIVLSVYFYVSTAVSILSICKCIVF